MNNSFWILLILLISIFGFSQCRTGHSSNENGRFDWDMSVENHTGESKCNYLKDGKHRGMSVFQWRSDEEDDINQLIKNNIECVAIVPYLFQKTERTKIIHPRKKTEGWTRSDSFFIGVIEKLHDRKLNVMLKPHLWMHDGWRSNIQMENEAEWDRWFDSYQKHMLSYAKMANEFDVELFCIGVEFKSSIIAQPERWNELIKEIKSIYHGKLTYAANWDGEFDHVQFWDQMDFIGIQAYFPLTKVNHPTIDEIKDGWKRHVDLLSELSKKHNKPILFTETGYRSDASATIEPWVWGSDLDTAVHKPSFITQNLAYEALFQELWEQDWFAGTYFWQWHNTSVEGSGYEKMDFTPRYKPAENTIAKWYGREN